MKLRFIQPFFHTTVVRWWLCDGGGKAEDIGDTAFPTLPEGVVPSDEAYRKSESSATWVPRDPFTGAVVEGVEGTCPALATLPINQD